MIRINLAPSKKRRATKTMISSPASGGGSGQIWLLGMLGLWLAMMGVGAWLVMLEEDAASALRAKTALKNQEIEAIRKEIDEEGLAQREAQVEQLEVAIKKLTAKRRTPAYVMYEMAMILTDTKDGGGPDIDQEKYRQNLKADPQSEINDRWDPTGLWLDEMIEEGGVLVLAGQARDATDLTEFTRRLRASARFGALSNPDFERIGNPGEQDEARFLKWKLSVGVRRWD